MGRAFTSGVRARQSGGPMIYPEFARIRLNSIAPDPLHKWGNRAIVGLDGPG
jgi:hypothetical protein